MWRDPVLYHVAVLVLLAFNLGMSVGARLERREHARRMAQR